MHFFSNCDTSAYFSNFRESFFISNFSKFRIHICPFFVCKVSRTGSVPPYLRFVPFFPERLCASCWRISSS